MALEPDWNNSCSLESSAVSLGNVLPGKKIYIFKTLLYITSASNILQQMINIDTIELQNAVTPLGVQPGQ